MQLDYKIKGSITNVGVIMDCNHIKAITETAFYHLQIANVRGCMVIED